MTSSLLIAGVGYLGTALQRQAPDAGWLPLGITKSGGSGLHACDLSSATAVNQLAQHLQETQQPSAIIHCASSGRGGAEAYQSVFVDGCQHLLAAFPGIPLLFVSSSSVYGQTDGQAVTEDSPTEPARETSQLLLRAEQLVLAAGGCVARLASLYGPGRCVLLQRFLAGQATIEKKEEGRRLLNQIHRDDAADALLHLLHLTPFPSGEIFNVCDSEPLPQIECYRELSALFQRPLPPVAPRKENDSDGRKRAWTNKRVSNAKLLRTGWQPHHPSFLHAAEELAPTLNSTDSA